MPGRDVATLDEILARLAAQEALQAGKVLELARRLRPGLTAEDIRNPHDFPDLDDVDWQFEDGQLVGLQGVIAALRALRHEWSSAEGARA